MNDSGSADNSFTTITLPSLGLTEVMTIIMTLAHLWAALCCLQSPSVSITSLDPPNGFTRQIDGAYCLHLPGEGTGA